MLITFRITSPARFLGAVLLICSLHVQAAEMERDIQGGVTVSPAIAALIDQAEAGDADAANTLGFQYGNGLSVMQNDAEAIKWYRKGAKLGSVEAEYNLGFAYQNGHGVKVDISEAVKWYRKAAEHDNADAQNALAQMYEQGLGVPQDYAQALKWYRKAAALGLGVAQESAQRIIDKKLVKN